MYPCLQNKVEIIMNLLQKLFMPRGTYNFWKRVHALRARVILNKRKRHKWKYMQDRLKADELVQKASWGVSYSVFDGEELLQDSLKIIRPHADYINIVYQRHSWYGNPANPRLVEILKKLQEQGLIDELIEYVPNYKLSAGKQERFKRNLGLKHAKKHGVDYFMCMDTDEFYIADEVIKAKKYIVTNGITHSFCPIATYATPTQRSLVPSYFVQFFSLIGPFSKLKWNRHSVALVDPTRQLNHIMGAKYYVLPALEMHHMTGYRKNLIKKFSNSSAAHARKKLVKGYSVKGYSDMLLEKSVTVPNIFKIKKL